MEIALERGGGRVGARSGCVIPAGTRHDYCGAGENRQLVLDLPIASVPAVAFAQPVFFSVDTVLARRVERLRQALETRGEAAAAVAQYDLLAALSDPVAPGANLARSQAPRFDFKRIDAFMRAHLDAPITTPQLAALTGMSARHFHARFVEIAGDTPHRHLLRLRLEHAAWLLRRDTAPLSDIALATGFSDQSAFTHAFRAYFGQPPRRWRLMPVQ